MRIVVKRMRRAIGRLRWTLQRVRWTLSGFMVFTTPFQYITLLSRRGDGRRVLKTRDGIKFYARENIWDARILREVFVERPYLRGFTDLPQSPTVVDIGGYIGDFSIYAARRLNAAQVIVYEPTTENWAMLKDNIALNGLGDRVTAVNQAVGASGTLVLNVESNGQEVHSSSYWYPDAVKREVPSVTLDELMAEHELAKIDCEGGEYDIIKCASDDALSRVARVTLEWHTVQGVTNPLETMTDRLRGAGFQMWGDGPILRGTRS